MSTLPQSPPSHRVAALEHEVVGCGANGRTGSIAMTVVGLGLGVMARLEGHAFVPEDWCHERGGMLA